MANGQYLKSELISALYAVASRASLDMPKLCYRTRDQRTIESLLLFA